MGFAACDLEAEPPPLAGGVSAASHRLASVVRSVLLLDVLLDDLQRSTAAREHAIAAGPEHGLGIHTRKLLGKHRAQTPAGAGLERIN